MSGGSPTHCHIFFLRINTTRGTRSQRLRSTTSSSSMKTNSRLCCYSSLCVVLRRNMPGTTYLARRSLKPSGQSGASLGLAPPITTLTKQGRQHSTAAQEQYRHVKGPVCGPLILHPSTCQSVRDIAIHLHAQETWVRQLAAQVSGVNHGGVTAYYATRKIRCTCTRVYCHTVTTTSTARLPDLGRCQHNILLLSHLVDPAELKRELQADHLPHHHCEAVAVG